MKKNDKFANLILAKPIPIFIIIGLLSFTLIKKIIFFNYNLPFLLEIIFSCFLSEIILRLVLLYIYMGKTIFLDFYLLKSKLIENADINSRKI